MVGNALQLGRDPLGFLKRCTRDYGDVVSLQLGRKPAYLLADPDAIEHVLVQNNQNYSKGDLFQEDLSNVFGDSLLTREGDRWRRQRHLIQPAFHPERIATYAQMMTEYTERRLADWHVGETRDIHEEMMQLTLEIVCKALFDTDIRGQEHSIGTAINIMTEVDRRIEQHPIPVPTWVPLPSYRRYNRALATLNEIVYEIIRERRQNTENADDVVSMLLQAEDEQGQPMTDQQLRDEVITLLLAGHETTALVLSYTWYLLAQHPTVEAKLVDELHTVLGERPPTMADLPELSYTEQVIKESMRLYPPVWAILRESIEEDDVAGYQTPAGTTIMLSQWVVHHDSRWFDDPRAFVPERWTEEFEQDLPHLVYFPFAAGPRRCIGDRFAMLEAQLLLATIAQRFHVELVSETPLALVPSVTVRPKDGIEMRLHER